MWLINGHTFAVAGSIATGLSAHGLYVSRDSQHLYVTNRLGESVSAVDERRQLGRAWALVREQPDDVGQQSSCLDDHRFARPDDQSHGGRIPVAVGIWDSTATARPDR